jgi:hypothetical protein
LISCRKFVAADANRQIYVLSDERFSSRSAPWAVASKAVRREFRAMTAMRSVQPQATSSKFLFTYRFNGVDWSIEVPAMSLEEAKERVKVLSFARSEDEKASSRNPPISERRSQRRFLSRIRSAQFY